MKSRTRLLILLILVVLFFTVAPYLVLYSLGYRIDFENRKIVATGGIYLRILPSGVSVLVDGRPSNTTGVFSNAVFIQNLLPKEHAVLVTKNAHYDYQKNISVKEKEVTKLENIILFSKNIPFELMADRAQFTLLKVRPPEKFVIKASNLYYADVLENAELTMDQKATPILKGIVAFKISDNDILWMGIDGFLKRSDLDGKNIQKISQFTLKINIKNPYRLEVLLGQIFLKEGDTLLLFNQETKSFTVFSNAVKDFKTSGDGQKIIYFNDKQILISLLNNLDEKILLANSPEKITEFYWLNNDYIIYSTINKIIISEIDYRGNVNSVTLPQTVNLTSSATATVEKPEIFFDQQNRRLYILTKSQLISSDKILP